jgi:hypothetical protein
MDEDGATGNWVMRGYEELRECENEKRWEWKVIFLDWIQSVVVLGTFLVVFV